MKPTPIADLLTDYKDGSSVKAVEGTLTKIFGPKTGESQYGPWFLQSGVLTDDDQNEIPITFAAEEVAQNDKAMRGKRIHIESSIGEKGEHGLKIKADKRDKAKLGLWVTSTARVSYPDGAPAPAERPASTPAKSAGAAPQASSQHASSRSYSNHGQTIGMCMKGAIDILRGGEASPTIEDIEATAWLLFEASQRLNARADGAPAPAASQSRSAPPAEVPSSTWKDAVYAAGKDGGADVLMGSLDDNKLKAIAAWAFANNPTDPAKLAVKTAAMEMMKDKKWDAARIFARAMLDKNINADKFAKYAQQEYGVSDSDLTEENFVHLLENLKAVVPGVEKITLDSNEDDDLPA